MPTLENSCEDTIEFTIVYRATELLAPGWGQCGEGSRSCRYATHGGPVAHSNLDRGDNWHTGGGEGGRQYVGQ